MLLTTIRQRIDHRKEGERVVKLAPKALDPQHRKSMTTPQIRLDIACRQKTGWAWYSSKHVVIGSSHGLALGNFHTSHISLFIF